MSIESGANAVIAPRVRIRRNRPRESGLSGRCAANGGTGRPAGRWFKGTDISGALSRGGAPLAAERVSGPTWDGETPVATIAIVLLIQNIMTGLSIPGPRRACQGRTGLTVQAPHPRLADP